MESMFIWVFVFAGVTVGLLGTLLFASERELRAKNRRLGELERKMVELGSAPSGEFSAESHTREAEKIDELNVLNESLTAEIAELRNRLEASRIQADELASAQVRSRDLESEITELRDSNRRLRDEHARSNDDLRSRQTQLDEAESRRRETDEKIQKLEAELTAAQERLATGESQIHDLELLKTRLHEAETQAAASGNDHRQLEDQISELQEDLAESRKKIVELEAFQGQLGHLERRFRQSDDENRRLQAALAEMESRAAEGPEYGRRLELVRDRLIALQRKQVEIAGNHRQIQDEIAQITQILDTGREAGKQGDLPLVASPTQTSETGDPASHITVDNTDDRPLESAMNLPDTGQNFDPLSCLETEMEEHPDRPEDRLNHLLASVRRYNVYGYEQRIDAIKDMPDLTEHERNSARDIFLLRADEAQKHGNDEEMLKYRSWAKNVIYRIPFGSTASEKSPLSEATENGDGTGYRAELRHLSDVPSTATLSSFRAAGGGKQKQALILGIVLVFLFVGVLAVGLLRSQPEGSFSESNPNVDRAAAPQPQDVATLDAAAVAAYRPSDPNPESTAAETQSSDNGAAAPNKVASPSASVAAKTTATQTARKPAANVAATPSKSRSIAAQSTPGIWGKYEVVQPTQVYSEATEGSETLASLVPGIKVNVVDGRNGWLEIRSKHGRPPGFIKKEAVARVREP